VDEARICYGNPQLQLLSLDPILEGRPELSGQLPSAFARLLPSLYPTFFAKADLRCLRNAVVFVGDRRQLQLAQRVRGALKQAYETRGAAVDMRSWRPAWREEIDRNLSEPFQSSGAEALTGSFAWLLRQSALSSQLRCTVLVDPQSMKEHAGDAIPELDVREKTVGQVLEQLARQAGLRMAVEGEIVWLRR